MIGKKIAHRYAKALMNIGREDGKYERYLAELDTFTSLYQKEGRLRDALRNPTINLQKRQAVITELGGRLGLSDVTTNFLRLLVEKDRIVHLPDIVVEYRRLVDEAAGRARVRLVTAYTLSVGKQEALKRVFERLVGKGVIMEVVQDPSIIGGVVAQIGDRIYDGSVRTQLQALKSRLAKG